MPDATDIGLREFQHLSSLRKFETLRIPRTNMSSDDFRILLNKSKERHESLDDREFWALAGEEETEVTTLELPNRWRHLKNEILASKLCEVAEFPDESRTAEPASD